jgi:N-acetylglucosamine kinase-like BadF-type ATPase
MLNRLSSVVGVDGGGTKTEAVIIDADQRVIGEGRAGPSNPLRVGIAAAAAAVREAIDDACASAKLRRGDLIAAEIGLAGARRRELRERWRHWASATLKWSLTLLLLCTVRLTVRRG